MNFKISFQERTKLGMEMLTKRLPITLKEARVQALRLKKESDSKNRRKRNS